MRTFLQTGAKESGRGRGGEGEGGRWRTREKKERKRDSIVRKTNGGMTLRQTGRKRERGEGGGRQKQRGLIHSTLMEHYDKFNRNSPLATDLRRTG